MNYLVSSAGSNLSPQAQVFVVGLGLAVIGAVALWRRDDLYLATQLLMSYRRGGLKYGVLQIVLPGVVVIVGLALMILSPTQ